MLGFYLLDSQSVSNNLNDMKYKRRNILKGSLLVIDDSAHAAFFIHHRKKTNQTKREAKQGLIKYA